MEGAGRVLVFWVWRMGWDGVGVVPEGRRGIEEGGSFGEASDAALADHGDGG